MRILVLGEGDADTFDAWSGIAKSLVTHLRSLGHEVITGDVDLYGLTRWVTIALTWSPNRFRWWAKYHLSGLPFRLRSRKAERLIQKHRDGVDIILQFGATFEPRGHLDTPYVIYCDGNARLAEHGDNQKQAEVTALTRRQSQAQIVREQRIYDEASRIFTFSDRLRHSFLEDFGQKADKVSVVYAGANLDPATVPVKTIRDQFHPPTILFVGRAFQRKGGDILLRAFANVRLEIPQAQLLIVGPEGLQVKEPGVTNLGFLRKDDVEDALRLQAAYRTADVFCLPTRYEPFGVVFIEAMLHGLACVGPMAWAVPEIVVDGQTGLLCPPEDVDSLSAALTHLLKHPDLAHTMGRRGRERAQQCFSWGAVAERITDGLEAIVGNEVE